MSAYNFLPDFGFVFIAHACVHLPHEKAPVNAGAKPNAVGTATTCRTAVFEDDVTRSCLSCAGVAASIRVPLPPLRCPLAADRAVRLRPEALGLLLPSPVCTGLARPPRYPLTVDRDAPPRVGVSGALHPWPVCLWLARAPARRSRFGLGHCAPDLGCYRCSWVPAASVHHRIETGLATPKPDITEVISVSRVLAPTIGLANRGCGQKQPSRSIYGHCSYGMWGASVRGRLHGTHSFGLGSTWIGRGT